MPTYSEQRTVPFHSHEMFDLVSDVARYPEFLPWCVGARIRTRQPALIVADLLIGYKFFRERFTSRVTLNPDAGRIDVEYADGPFKYLVSHWIFEDCPEGCRIDFHVDFEFRSAMLETMISGLFSGAVHRMVAAFEKRAQSLHTPISTARPAAGSP